MAHWAHALTIAVLTAGSVPAPGLACGDKFFVSGRGTRYQRPKLSRAASVLNYADPASSIAAILTSDKLDAALRREGHRSTLVQTNRELATTLAAGRFDVVLTADALSASVARAIGQSTGAAAIVPLDAQPRGRSLIEAIDLAVEKRDRELHKALGVE